jgi:hypothetical protein
LLTLPLLKYKIMLAYLSLAQSCQVCSALMLLGANFFLMRQRNAVAYIHLERLTCKVPSPVYCRVVSRALKSCPKYRQHALRLHNFSDSPASNIVARIGSDPFSSSTSCPISYDPVDFCSLSIFVPLSRLASPFFAEQILEKKTNQVSTRTFESSASRARSPLPSMITRLVYNK